MVPAFRAALSGASLFLLASGVGLVRADRAFADGFPSRAVASADGCVRRLGQDERLPQRAAGRPGDFLLSSPSARAVVRSDDGALVDFFRVPPAPASVPQLRGEAYLDGLTLFRPFIQAGSVRYELRGPPAVSDGALESREELSIAGARVRVVTRYVLAKDQPLLDVITQISHVGGSELETLSVGERVRWGNSDYFVDGKRAKASFSGAAFEIGRKGAGGDLLLIPASGRMQVTFQSTQPGLMGELSTQHGSFPLRKSGEKLIRRTLLYRPLHDPGQAPGSAVLEVEISDDRGQPLASKLSFRGLAGTHDPDFGNDGDERGANRFVYSGNGRFKRALPPGRYRVMATAGIERDLLTWDVGLASGQVERRAGRLLRVIETPGRIAADLHLHQAPSPDADISNTTRVVSIAAEGVEFAVASDHYAAGDLQPALTALAQSGELTTRLRVMRGSEITTQGHDFGHFNVFPLDSVAGIPFENTTPRALFSAVRRLAPSALLQVNHPRWPKSYFSRYALDPKLVVVRPEFASQYSEDFDAIEVFNGFDAWSEALVRNVLRDYLRLLKRGKRYTATGNSDSHGLFFVDPGMPRNLVAYGSAGNDDEDLDVDPRAVIEAVRRGQVVVTNGPVIDFEVNGVGPGGTAKTGGKPCKVRLWVRAAPWIDVSQVELLRGGGERVRSLPIAPSTDVTRLRYETTLQGDGATFFVVVVRGKRPLPNVYRPGVRPFAFTNPIFIQP
jgi:hypothetical protein